MSVGSVYESVKKATVTIVAEIPATFPKRPFTIIGSGFCIDPIGTVVTCEHVFKAFLPTQGVNPGTLFQLTAPQAMFYGGRKGTQLYMYPVPARRVGVVTGHDLAAMRLGPHPAYPNGYPTLPIADYGELHEMMEVATCGFPLGEVLQDQLGTVTSSFTKGMISSIIPAQGVDLQYLDGFQLDLTATNGNSRGPVFCLASGKVFGVLQRGIGHPQTGHVVQGLTKAEPIYPVLKDDFLDGLRKLE